MLNKAGAAPSTFLCWLAKTTPHGMQGANLSAFRRPTDGLSSHSKAPFWHDREQTMAAPAGPSDRHGAGDTARARSAELVAAVFRALESVDGDVSPQLARSVQARINVVKQIGREFGLLTESEAQAALGQGNAAALPELWVRYRGETLYPGFLFEPSPGSDVPMRVRPLLKDLKEIASEYGWDGSAVVFWMTSPTTLFADQARPVDHLHEPAKVIAAFTDAAGNRM
jgi:hypothetical protein